MSVLTRTILLLSVSNMFMLTAWYLHLKMLNHKPWYIASLVSWGIAFFEYTVHIPANRIGHTALTLTQLQILQVGMSLMIFIPFTVFVMGSPVKTDYLWASLCLVGAAYFIFRGIWCGVVPHSHEMDSWSARIASAAWRISFILRYEPYKPYSQKGSI